MSRPPGAPPTTPKPEIRSDIFERIKSRENEVARGTSSASSGLNRPEMDERCIEKLEETMEEELNNLDIYKHKRDQAISD